MNHLYLAHFGLAAPPFSITPNPAFFFGGGGRGALLAALEYSARHQEGIVAVTGEVGSGKTMLCRMLLTRCAADIEPVYLCNPSLGRREILSAILADLRAAATPRAGRTGNLLDQLHRRLIAHHAAGRRVLLVIDEAHVVPPATLEEIRLLSNLETSEHKLLQIVLFGQPELDALLLRQALRPLRDRVVERLEVPPLTIAETGQYLACRLRSAGHAGDSPFSRGAVAALRRAAGGLIRSTNVIADKAMLSAFTRGRRQVDARDIDRAVRAGHRSPVAPIATPRYQAHP